MTDPQMPPSPEPPIPEIARPHTWSPSLIWLVPLIAAIAGLSLVLHTYMQEGPTITISFLTAEGLEAGKTQVLYKNVVIGKVHHIDLSDDRKQVEVTVELTKNASSIAVNDTRFWVERPRIGLGGISGIDTLLSGAYIGVDVGTSTESRRQFTGLEKPPALTHDLVGRRFILHTSDPGSLSIGSPVYYRKMPVGQVVASELAKDGKTVTVQVFVTSPFDRFVTRSAHFWNASGVDLSLSAAGLKLNTQSLATVIAGGIAFQETTESGTDAPAPQDSEFTLFPDQSTALAPLDGLAETVLMKFHSSTRGLTVGSPVDFRGLTLGVVKSIDLEFDPDTKNFHTNVTADLFPDRMGNARQTMLRAEKAAGITHADMIHTLVERGLRAQLRSGNLLTGQMYIALDMLPNAKPVSFDPHATPLVIPTAAGDLEQAQVQLQDIIRKLDAIPFERIGNNLNETLASARNLLRQLDHDLAPQAKKTLEDVQTTLQSLNQNLASPDAPLQQNAQKTLEQIDRTAASLRALADYLEQHPESLVRGKPPASEPGPDSGRSQTP
ncbi:MAG: intermembrane transport protein PqiB [Stenotrophobium sp.]